MDPQSAVKRENQMKDDEFCLDIPYEEIKVSEGQGSCNLERE